VIFRYLIEKYGKTLAYPNFHFWWGDDRCVPPHNDDSNYKWATDLWLKPIGITPEKIHRVLGENDPEQEVFRYAGEIRKFIPFENGLPVFDYMLLGLGEDGHTASIFPCQMNLLTSTKICEVATHPVSGQKRITLTGPVINHSRTIVFLATGENKAQRVRDIAVDQLPQYTASHIGSSSGRVIWLVDSDAAKLL